MKLKILYVIHTPKDPKTAVYRTCLELKDFFERDGHRLDILSPDDMPSPFHKGQGINLVYPFQAAAWIWNRRHDFDMILFHSFSGWVFNLLRFFAAGRPAAVTLFHGLEPLYFRTLEEESVRMGKPLSLRFRLFFGGFMNAVIYISCRLSDALFCLNQHERIFLERGGYHAAGRIFVLPNGAPEKFFIKRSYADTASELLYVGRWAFRKGVHYLAEAFERLSARNASLRLRMVGTFASKEEIAREFPFLGGDNVEVVPSVDDEDLLDYYRNADIFVFPTLFEGFSLALIEAMAAGLPVVAASAGAAAGLIRTGENGILIAPGDSGALANAVTELLRSGERRAKLGGNAQETARAYDSEAAAGAWLDACRKVAGNL